MSKSKGPWISFRELDKPPEKKTKVWMIHTKDERQLCIGGIRWNTGWRRYVFEPQPDTIWEQDCLRTVAEFIEQQTMAHKEAAKKRIST